MHVSRFSVFEYLYRDGGNFKAWGALLLKDALTDAQVTQMRSKFESNEFFIAEQIGVPPLYDKLWAYSSGFTANDHVWHEFFALRPAEVNDLTIGAPWGTATMLYEAITNVSQWNERLSVHYEFARYQYAAF